MQSPRVTLQDWNDRLSAYTADSLTDALDRQQRPMASQHGPGDGSPSKRFGTAWGKGWSTSAVAVSRVTARKRIVSHPLKLDPSEL